MDTEGKNKMPKTIKKILFAAKKHKYELTPQELREYEKLRKRRYRYIKPRKKQQDANFRKYKTGDMHDEYYTPEHYFYEAMGDIEKVFNIKIQNPRINNVFKPGGDYEHETYDLSQTIVDNPPFSLLHEICEFYNNRGIKFILFFSNPVFIKPSIENGQGESKFSAILNGHDISDGLNQTKNVKINLITNIPDHPHYFIRKSEKGELIPGIPQYRTKEQIKAIEAERAIKLKARGGKV